jgi:hypothetical protein
MLLIFALVTSGLWATETDANTPQLFIPEAVFEFEPVLENDYVIHKFTIQNKGTAELAITRVKSG